MRTFNVYTPTNKTARFVKFGCLIDTVFFDETCDSEYVKTSLINHDGYRSDIIAVEVK